MNVYLVDKDGKRLRNTSLRNIETLPRIGEHLNLRGDDGLVAETFVVTDVIHDPDNYQVEIEVDYC